MGNNPIEGSKRSIGMFNGWWLGNNPLAQNKASVGTFPTLTSQALSTTRMSATVRLFDVQLCVSLARDRVGEAGGGGPSPVSGVARPEPEPVAAQRRPSGHEHLTSTHRTSRRAVFGFSEGCVARAERSAARPALVGFDDPQECRNGWGRGKLPSRWRSRPARAGFISPLNHRAGCDACDRVPPVAARCEM
jgi:hypothetical protein